MSRYIYTYGAIAGFFIILTILLGVVLGGNDSSFASEAFGFTVMLVALSMIFVAIKRYRDRELGGVIRFGQAVALGMGIAAVAGVAYVAVWELYLAATDYAFIEQYWEAQREAMVAKGASTEDIAAALAQKEAYTKLWYRLPITFIEIFPVGALVALISAGILRNSRVLSA